MKKLVNAYNNIDSFNMLFLPYVVYSTIEEHHPDTLHCLGAFRNSDDALAYAQHLQNQGKAVEVTSTFEMKKGLNTGRYHFDDNADPLHSALFF